MLITATANATNYYVSPWGDNSDGSTWAKAWTHPNSTNDGMNGNDTVFIAPGTYDSTYILPDAANVYACSTLAAMDSLRKVTKLRGTLPLTGGTWLQRGSTNTWRYSIELPARWNAFTTFSDVGWAILMRIDGGVRTMQHSLNASSGGESIANLDAALEYLKDPRDDDSLYVYSTTDPNGSSWAYGNAPVVMFGDSDDNVSFLGLTIEEGYQGVLVIGTSDITTDQPDSLLVSHCNIRNGSHVMSAGNLGLIFGSGYGTTWTSTQYGEFNTFVADSFDYAWAPGDDFSAGAAFDFYSQRQCLIDSCWFGAGLNMGAIMYKNGGGAKTVKAYANRITNCTFVGTGSTTQKASIWIGGNNDSVVISGNVFNTARYAAIALYRDDRSIGRVKILNNTFFSCGHPSFSPAIQFSAYFYDSTGSNECKYNVFYDTATVSPQVQFLQGDVSGSQTPSVESQWDIDSNRYYFKTGGNFVTSFLSGSGCTGTNFAAWRSCGFDVQGDTGINPNFAVAGSDFSRPSASGEMNRTYGGKTWTIYGAVQNAAAACADTLVAPVFQTPSNGATGQVNSVILDWSDSTQAGTVDLYDLQVDNNSDFSSVTFSSATAWSKDTVTTTLAYLTTYYWRVRGRSDCDTSAWSGYRSFVMGDTCIVITGKTSLATSDTCYCVVDSLIYNFAQWDTLINTNGKDNIRIWGYHAGGGRGIIGYSASDTGSNATVTDLQKGSVVLHVNGSDNVLIKNLAIVPRAIDDSVRGIVCVNAATVVGINLDNDSLVAGGFSSRAYQQSTTGANRSFNQLLQNSYFGTVSKGYHRRDALYGATLRFTTSILASDRYGGSYLYSYKVRNNRIHTIHTGVGSAGFTVDTTPNPDDTLYPLIYVDSNTITVDARNDLFMTYDDNDVNNSAGDPYGVGVDGVDRGSRITGNSISSMASTHYGGDGLLLQHIDATVDTPFAVYNNTFALQHGAHPRIAEGRQAVVGTYIRNYDANYFVKGLWYHHNYGYLVVDEDTTTTYAGRYGECVRMGFENGANGNVIENNHFTLIPRDSLTRTGAGALEVSGLTFEQHDSTNSAGDAGTGNNVARYNYWRVPRNPIWLGGTRIGIGADNVLIVGDTCNTIYNGDSTFVRFHQSGTYYGHSINNVIRNVVLQGFANYTDVIKGTITSGTDTLGKQLSLEVTSNVLVTNGSTPISGATVWAFDETGTRRYNFSNTNGSGLTNRDIRWNFRALDPFLDTYTFADSTNYHPLTLWAKYGSDSASVSLSDVSPYINGALTDTIAISISATPTVMQIFRGVTLRGTVIK